MTDPGSSPYPPALVLAKLRFVLRQAISVSLRSFGVTLVAVVTIAVALTVLGTFVVVLRTLGDAADALAKEVEVSAYLHTETSVPTGTALATQVQQWPEVQLAHYVSSTVAMSDFARTLGEEARLLEGLPVGVLPASVELRLNREAWSAEQVGTLAARLEGLAEVEDVRFGQEDIREIDAFLSITRIIAWVLGSALCLATVLLVSNTIRLTVYARRDEIEVMTLVGATPGFVRIPFVVEGALHGLVGGALALGAMMALQQGLRLVLTRTLDVAIPLTLAFQPLQYFVVLLTLGLILGVVGSMLAVGRFLRV